MTTQLFKAKDVKSAISKVTEEFGNDAIILSTKKNNGLVEIEASNDNNILTSFPRNNQENKAVLTPPICNHPVGLGANLVFIIYRVNLKSSTTAPGMVEL